LDWPGPQEGHYARHEDHGLALFEEDKWNEALECSRSRADSQPADKETHRCLYRSTGSLEVGGQAIWAAVYHHSHEWDGMYGDEEDIVLLTGGRTPTVLHTLNQWDRNVVDCRTTLKSRRYRTVDLDGDKVTELCIETKEEVGEGLFYMMDLGDHSLPWLPISSARSFAAFSFDSKKNKLVRRPQLEGKCPADGYKTFVPYDSFGDAANYRRSLQGEATELAQCPLIPYDTCFEIEECPGVEEGVSSVAGIAQPPVVPWGALAAKVGQDPESEDSGLVGVRSRVMLKERRDHSFPVLAVGAKAVMRYEVKNVSKKTQVVWHAGFWPNHRVRLYRPNGGEAPLTPYGKKVLQAFAPRGKRGKNVRWSLPPGKVDITEGDYDLTELYDLSVPGVYLLQIEYEEDFAMATNVLPIRVVTKGVPKP